jgi:hypothetical protein
LIQINWIVGAAAALLLTACAQQPKMAWIRADGQRAAGDPVLSHQFQMARTVCLGEREKANLSGVTVTRGGLAGALAAQDRADSADQVGAGCMAEKGYVQVLEDEAEAKRQEFAAIEAEKARRDAATRVAASVSKKKVAAAN